MTVSSETIELSSHEELAQDVRAAQTRRSIGFYMQDFSGGGVERMRLSLIEALCAQGVCVTLIVGSDVGPLKHLLPADLPVTILRCSRTVMSIIPLALILRRARLDMLITSLDHNNIAALLAKLISFSSCPIVICQHNALSSELGLGWKYRAVPLAYRILRRLAASIVAVSDGVADDLAQSCKISRSAITTIYNPVVGKNFEARSSEPVLHTWFLEKDLPIFVFVGRLVDQKNPEMLLHAFSSVLGRKAARLIFIGDGPLRAALLAQVDLLGMSHCVDFVGFQANPLPWIRRADALVLTSNYEGFGNVIAEALALGTPVVATDCPFGPSEILKGGQYGHLTRCNDVASTSAALSAVLVTTWDKMVLKQRGNSFTASACAEAHLELLERCERPKSNRHPPSLVLGVRLATATAREAVDFLISHPPHDAVRLVVTPNLDHLKCLREPDFRSAYNWAHLCFADGFPLVIYARYKGLNLRTRVTGCEIFHQIAHHPRLAEQRLFFVVESEHTRLAIGAWALERAISSQVLCVVAEVDLTHNPKAQLSLASSAKHFRPSLIIMTLGAPLSELFIYRHREQLPRCWAICVGQAVRIELGLTKRAPLLWQKLNLEWLWRVHQEPQRLSLKYLKSVSWFAVAICKDAFRK